MSAYSDLILSHGADLVAYYRMADTNVADGGVLTDSSGNGRHGVVRGDPVTSANTANQTGAIVGDSDKAIKFGNSAPGGAVLFTGAGPYTNLISNAFSGAAAVSAEMWFKRDGTSLNPISLFSLWGESTGVKRMLSIENHATDGYSIYARSVASEVEESLANIGGATGTADFNHAVVVANFAADTLAFYLNGALVSSASKTFDNNSFTYSIPLSEGDTATGGADRIGFFGLNQHITDEVAFYKVGLAGAQVAEHYAIGKQLKNNFLMKPKPVKGFYSVRHLGL